MSEISRKNRRRDMVTALKQATDKELANYQVLLSHERTKRAAKLFPELAGRPIEFLVRNEKYDPSEVLALLTDAYYKGIEARGEIDDAAMRLAWLLQNILYIVEYGEYQARIEGLLLDLARQEAEGDLKFLAGEITKRFDILTSAWSETMPSDFSRYNNIIYEDMKSIREAILELHKGKGIEALHQNLGRLGTIAKWSRPKKAEGMSEERAWLAQKAYAIFEIDKIYQMAGEKILGEIAEKGGPTDSLEQYAYDTLNKYIKDSGNIYEAREKMKKYLKDLVYRWKNGKS